MADPEFVTTRQAAQRLGVSLGTVQHMVESGALEAWKTLGGHRRIPLAALEAHLGRRRSMTPSVSDANGQIDVLIAEDDPSLQTLYRLTMERWEMPINLRIVNNGFDGLVQVGNRPPDVLISDLMMPGMDGFEMIRRLRDNADLARRPRLEEHAQRGHDVPETCADLHLFGKRQRRTHLVRNRCAQVLGPRFVDLDDAGQERDAFFAGGLAEGLKSTPRGGHCLVHVVGVAQGNVVQGFFCGGVDHGAGFGLRGLDPCAVDVELQMLDHGVLEWIETTTLLQGNLFPVSTPWRHAMG